MHILTDGNKTLVLTGNIVNLTPHEVVIIRDGEKIVYPASGFVARVSSTPQSVGEIDGVPIHKIVYGDVKIYQGNTDDESTYYVDENKVNEDTYIVSAIVAQAWKNTNIRYICPNTNSPIRENGAIVGVTGWAIYS